MVYAHIAIAVKIRSSSFFGGASGPSQPAKRTRRRSIAAYTGCLEGTVPGSTGGYALREFRQRR